MKGGAQNQITFKCLVLSCTARTTNFWRFLKLEGISIFVMSEE